jgi:DNA primase
MSDIELQEQLKELGIKVVRINGREVACLCPIHNDKSPSFFFNLDSERFNCFVGCLKGRGIHQLAFQLNKKLDSTASTPLSHQLRVSEKVEVPHIPSLPSALNTPGEKYLASRKLNSDSISKWNIMYWAEKEAIVIPIEDAGYITRRIKEKKYLTIPGTKIGSTLFGLSQFNPLAGSAILVEGSLDCIWLHQIGFNNALAIMHTSLTPTQYTLLQGITSKIYLMLDGDSPGETAAGKLKQQLKSNFIVKTVKLPEGKDPDNLSRPEILTLVNESV